MTLPRKGRRRIVVDGVAYHWHVRGRPTYIQGMAWTPQTYAVEFADDPGAVLVVRTPHPHSGNWLERPGGPVLPAQVAHDIRHALREGWRPDRAGPPFTLDRSAGFVPFG
jgi:hypothetical protein